jgi:hypothetical protein
LKNYLSLVQDSVVNHALRFLGQERILCYLGVYPQDALPISLLDLPVKPTEPTPPIHSIPVELLGEIFTHYINIPYQRDITRKSQKPSWSRRSELDSRLSAGRMYQGNPFILGKVCGLWRHIVEIMPTLWQSLSVDIPKIGHIPLIKRWLSRVGECPLTLELRQSIDSSAEELQATDTILSLFVEHIHRWTCIRFSISNSRNCVLSRLSEGLALSLQHAEINAGSWDYPSGDSMWRTIHSSPLLSSVRWFTFYSVADLPDHVPWGRLTEVDLSYEPDAGSTLEILYQCDRLVKLTVRGLDSPSNFTSALPSIILFNLRVLDISAVNSPGPFLEKLITPNLISLKILHHFKLPAIAPPLFPSVRQLLERSS